RRSPALRARSLPPTLHLPTDLASCPGRADRGGHPDPPPRPGDLHPPPQDCPAAGSQCGRAQLLPGPTDRGHLGEPHAALHTTQCRCRFQPPPAHLPEHPDRLLRTPPRGRRRPHGRGTHPRTRPLHPRHHRRRLPERLLLPTPPLPLRHHHGPRRPVHRGH